MLFGRVSGAPGGPTAVGSRPGAGGLPLAPAVGATRADAGAQPLVLGARRAGSTLSGISLGTHRPIASCRAVLVVAPSCPRAALRSDATGAGLRSGRLAGRVAPPQASGGAAADRRRPAGSSRRAARARLPCAPHARAEDVEAPGIGAPSAAPAAPARGGVGVALGLGPGLGLPPRARGSGGLCAPRPSRVARSSASGDVPELEPAALVLTMPRRGPEEDSPASARSSALAAAEAEDDEDSLSPLSPLAPFPSPSEPSSRLVPAIFGVSFQDVYYWLNCAYWGAVLLAVALGHETLTGVLSFPLYTLAMCLASAGFAAYYGARAFAGARKETREARREAEKAEGSRGGKGGGLVAREGRGDGEAAGGSGSSSSASSSSSSSPSSSASSSSSSSPSSSASSSSSSSPSSSASSPGAGGVAAAASSGAPSAPLSPLPRRAALRAFARYGWNALFWGGFVAWAVIPPSARAADVLGPPAVVAAAYGALLALASFAVSGSYTFLGGPKVPAKLITAGPHALLRHPQTLGNFLFLVGFALAGGAVWAALVFALSLWLYLVAVVPDQRAAMEHKFGEPFKAYARRVPAFRNGLVVLLVVEAVALWRMAPWEGLAAPR